MVPHPSAGAIPLNPGVITLRWEGETWFNRFHVTLFYVSKVTISILPCISTVSSFGILASGSDKGYAETMPTQLVEKEDSSQTTRFPWLNSKYQRGWFFLSEFTAPPPSFLFLLNQQNQIDLSVLLRQTGKFTFVKHLSCARLCAGHITHTVM